MSLRNAMGRHRPSALLTDIRRTVTSNPKRFISLFVITALGATMLVGLQAACDDLRASADSFFDAQHLFDISVQSTLGLTQADVERLAALDGVSAAEGGYTETAYTEVGDTRDRVDVKALSERGMNEPRVLQGELPKTAGEVAVSAKYLDASGKKIGDLVSFDVSASDASASTTEGDAAEQDAADDQDVFQPGSYRITASVLDPMDVNAGGKTMAFRSTSGSKYAFFLARDAVRDRSVFTVAYLSVAGADALPCYSDAYRARIDRVKQRAEAVRASREAERTSEVKSASTAKIDKSERELRVRLDDGARQLADGRERLDESRGELARGKGELSLQEALADRQIAEASAKIQSGYERLGDARAQLDSKEASLPGQRERLEQAREQADRQSAAARSELAGKIAAVRAAVDASERELNGKIGQLKAEAARAARTLDGYGDYGMAWPAATWSSIATTSDSTASARAVQAYQEIISGYQDAFSREKPALAQRLTDQIAADEASMAELDPADPRHRELEADVARCQQGLEQLDAVPGELASASALGASMGEMMVSEPGARAEIAQKRAEIAAREQAGEQRIAHETAAALARLDAARQQLDQAPAQIKRARAQIARTTAQLDAAAETLCAQRASARACLVAARAQLDAAASKIAAGQQTLDEQRGSYESGRADAEGRLADARAKVDALKGATWYIQDRTALASYASVDSDASSIGAIATVFPVIFFIVAVLIGLTTVTRMVEEQRGLIGLYKALGYGRASILLKYLSYAIAASVAGGVVGDAIGFIAMPKVIFAIFATMYALPSFDLAFSALYALLGVGLFAVAIVGAAFLACHRDLREVPASLMRPRAPRAGKRIALERIGPIWRRMSFLSKVTVRNLFRYKRRFFMTVFGIAGCMALMVCGLGIRDTVLSFKPRQYGAGGISRYDLMAVAADGDYTRARDAVTDSGEVRDLLGLRIDSVTATFGGTQESMQIMVVPDDADLSSYVRLTSMAGEPLRLSASGTDALITKNAQQVLSFGVGDTVSLQDSALNTGRVRIAGVTVNYLGNYVFMTSSGYKRAFGIDYEPNAVLAHLRGSSSEQIKLADKLGENRVFHSVISTAKSSTQFSASFRVIDIVVYIVTSMAATLAFAVVFTLTSTNISERERELATIKVLGFRPREVRRYINKETIILTLIGIVLGCPLGFAITRLLAVVLRMPSLFFDTIVDPATYLIAGATSLAFTLIVIAMTNRSLDRVDMVGALKSTE